MNQRLGWERAGKLTQRAGKLAVGVNERIERHG
jgi:hypothetical protein